MYFYSKLFVGKSIRNPELVRFRLRHGIGQPRIYVLILNTQEDIAHPVEIMHSAFLKQPYYRENPPCILGIAHGKAEALEMLRILAENTFRSTGGFDIRGYLFPHGIRRTKGA